MTNEYFDDLSVRYGEPTNLESSAELKKLLEDSGFLKEPKRTKRETLYWDDAMIKRLFNEFKQGLHKFVTVSQGAGKERIVESRQKNVFADITCLKDGKEMKLKQFVQKITKYSDGRVDEIGEELPKTGTSSVSDRLPIDKVVDPLTAIKDAIFRETGFTDDQYEITSEPTQEVQDQLSGGYPNLPVHLDIKRYKIRLLGDTEDVYTKDDLPIPSDNTQVIKRHIFRWVEV